MDNEKIPGYTFKVVDVMIPMILNLIIEVHANQLAFNKAIAEILEDEKLSSSFQNILRRVKSESDLVRAEFLKKLFAEHGEIPDEIKKILSRKN